MSLPLLLHENRQCWLVRESLDIVGLHGTNGVPLYKLWQELAGREATLGRNKTGAGFVYLDEDAPTRQLTLNEKYDVWRDLGRFVKAFEKGNPTQVAPTAVDLAQDKLYMVRGNERVRYRAVGGLGPELVSPLHYALLDLIGFFGEAGVARGDLRDKIKSRMRHVGKEEYDLDGEMKKLVKMGFCIQGQTVHAPQKRTFRLARFKGIRPSLDISHQFYEDIHARVVEILRTVNDLFNVEIVAWSDVVAILGCRMNLSKMKEMERLLRVKLKGKKPGAVELEFIQCFFPSLHNDDRVSVESNFEAAFNCDGQEKIWAVKLSSPKGRHKPLTEEEEELRKNSVFMQGTVGQREPGRVKGMSIHDQVSLLVLRSQKDGVLVHKMNDLLHTDLTKMVRSKRWGDQLNDCGIQLLKDEENLLNRANKMHVFTSTDAGRATFETYEYAKEAADRVARLNPKEFDPKMFHPPPRSKRATKKVSEKERLQRGLLQDYLETKAEQGVPQEFPLHDLVSRVNKTQQRIHRNNKKFTAAGVVALLKILMKKGQPLELIDNHDGKTIVRITGPGVLGFFQEEEDGDEENDDDEEADEEEEEEEDEGEDDGDSDDENKNEGTLKVTQNFQNALRIVNWGHWNAILIADEINRFSVSTKRTKRKANVLKETRLRKATPKERKKKSSNNKKPRIELDQDEDNNSDDGEEEEEGHDDDNENNVTVNEEEESVAKWVSTDESSSSRKMFSPRKARTLHLTFQEKERLWQVYLQTMNYDRAIAAVGLETDQAESTGVRTILQKRLKAPLQMPVINMRAIVNENVTQKRRDFPLAHAQRNWIMNLLWYVAHHPKTDSSAYDEREELFKGGPYAEFRTKTDASVYEELISMGWAVSGPMQEEKFTDFARRTHLRPYFHTFFRDLFENHSKIRILSDYLGREGEIKGRFSNPSEEKMEIPKEVSGTDVVDILRRCASGVGHLEIEYEDGGKAGSDNMAHAPRVRIASLPEYEPKVKCYLVAGSLDEQRSNEDVGKEKVNDKDASTLLKQIEDTGANGLETNAVNPRLLDLLESTGKVVVVPCFDHNRAVSTKHAHQWCIEEDDNKWIVVHKWTDVPHRKVDEKFKNLLTQLCLDIIIDKPGYSLDGFASLTYPLLDPIDVENLLQPMLRDRLIESYNHTMRDGRSVKLYRPVLENLNKLKVLQ